MLELEGEREINDVEIERGSLMGDKSNIHGSESPSVILELQWCYYRHSATCRK